MFTKSYKLGIYSILEVIMVYQKLGSEFRSRKKRVLQRNERPWHYWYGPVKGHLSHSPQPHDMQEDDYSMYIWGDGGFRFSSNAQQWCKIWKSTFLCISKETFAPMLDNVKKSVLSLSSIE